MKAEKVYAMKDASGLVKIGIAASPKIRLKTLATGNPTIELVYTTKKLSNAREVESECHKAMASLKVSGEWFQCSIDDAIGYINDSVELYGVPFDLKDNHDNERLSIRALKGAASSGVKIKAISDIAGISYYRASSVINPGSYRGIAKFTKDEDESIIETIKYILNSIGNRSETIDGISLRVASSIAAGVKIEKISEISKVSYHKVAYCANQKSYNKSAKLSEGEASNINNALDSIKKDIESFIDN